jgi:N-acyl-D-amino-acid deacylase
MGWDPRPATPEELEEMRAITRAWMEAGAVGFNTGLDYQPAASSDTHELVELARVVGAYGGFYAAHIRYAGVGRTEAYRESIAIGREAGVPIRLSHESVDDETEPLLEEARDAGVDLGIDWYAYPAGSSHLLVLLPPEDQIGGFDAVIERVRDPAHRRRIGAFLEERLRETNDAGGHEYFSDTHTGLHVGRSIAEIAADRGTSLGETAVDLIVEESPEALLVFRRGLTDSAFEAIVRRTLQRPELIISSDGIYHGARPHPRGYGTFARILRRYVRELGVLGLEDAVRRMTGLPAERFAIRERGHVAEGLAADLVVFDAATVGDRATWEEPRRTAVGIDAVVVSGQIVADHGQPTGRLPGRVIAGPGHA